MEGFNIKKAPASVTETSPEKDPELDSIPNEAVLDALIKKNEALSAGVNRNEEGSEGSFIETRSELGEQQRMALRETLEEAGVMLGED